MKSGWKCREMCSNLQWRLISIIRRKQYIVSESKELFYILIIVVFTWLYTFVKTYQTIHFKWVFLFYVNYASKKLIM